MLAIVENLLKIKRSCKKKKKNCTHNFIAWTGVDGSKYMVVCLSMLNPVRWKKKVTKSEVTLLMTSLVLICDVNNRFDKFYKANRHVCLCV